MLDAIAAESSATDAAGAGVLGGACCSLGHLRSLKGTSRDTPVSGLRGGFGLDVRGFVFWSLQCLRCEVVPRSRAFGLNPKPLNPKP